MGLMLATLAAARPYADGSWSSNKIGPICAVAAVVLFIVGKLVYDHVQDSRAHEGVSSFKRRRVRRSGIAVNATVLSSVRLEQRTANDPSVLFTPATYDDSHRTSYYSIVYEVVTPSGETFRAKGVEEMPQGYVSKFASRNFELQVGETVAVRYDPVDHIIVLMDPLSEAPRGGAAGRRGGTAG